jgi:hypothetical protein
MQKAVKAIFQSPIARALALISCPNQLLPGHEHGAARNAVGLELEVVLDRARDMRSADHADSDGRVLIPMTRFSTEPAWREDA